MHFDNSDLYYEHVARSAVNAPFHFVASKAIAAALAVQQGPLRVVVPDAVRCMDGPAVVAATHRSWLDIPLFVQATERGGTHHARPMAKGQWFRNRFIGWVFHEWGAVALDRNKPNLNGINLAFGAFLDAGNSVLAFTEGTRVQTEQEQCSGQSGLRSSLQVSTVSRSFPSPLRGSRWATSGVQQVWGCRWSPCSASQLCCPRLQLARLRRRANC